MTVVMNNSKYTESFFKQQNPNIYWSGDWAWCTYLITTLQRKVSLVKQKMAALREKTLGVEKTCKGISTDYEELCDDYDELVENLDYIQQCDNIKLRCLKERVKGRDLATYLAKLFSGWEGIEYDPYSTILTAFHIGSSKMGQRYPRDIIISKLVSGRLR